MRSRSVRLGAVALIATAIPWAVAPLSTTAAEPSGAASEPAGPTSRFTDFNKRFQFDVPAGWTATTLHNGEAAVVLRRSDDGDLAVPATILVRFAILTNDQWLDTTLDSFLRERVREVMSGAGDAAKAEGETPDIKLDTVRAKQADVRITGETDAFRVRTIACVISHVTIEIQTLVDAKAPPERIDAANAIAASFKVTSTGDE